MNRWGIMPSSYHHSLFTWPGALMVFLLAWSIFWKGWSLWEAARNKSKGWFIALLLLNSVGILGIAYLFFFSANFQSNRKRLKKIFSK